MINLDTDHFEVIINQKSNNAAKQKKDRFFTDYLRKYVDKYVLEKDCEAMKTELCAKNLRKQFLQSRRIFIFTFETNSQ